MILIRAAGTPQETQLNMRIGGDFAKLALFQEPDRPETGDEIHSKFFDEPRVVTQVNPEFSGGSALYWKAAIVPRSKWNRLHATVQRRSIAMPSTIPPYEGPTSDASSGPRTEPAITRKAKRARRNPKYEQIEKALREFSGAHPTSHQEVFQLLDTRKVPIPNRKLFKNAGGWLKGFQQNGHASSAWLSQTWGRLGLPPFGRSPKK